MHMSRFAVVATIAPHDPAAELIGEFSVGRQPPGSTINRGRRSRSFSTVEMIEAIRQRAARYGEPPLTIDWELARARRLGQSWRAERFQCGRWPSVRVVRRQFPTFNAAIRGGWARPATGSEPRERSTIRDQRQEQLAANRRAVAQAGASETQTVRATSTLHGA